jgi:cation diffusion facilitator family transporter
VNLNRIGMKASGIAIAVNVVLAAAKITVGIIGTASALVADGIESSADIFVSTIVWVGFRISDRPPDRTHPYGHGKAESIAAVVVSASLLVAAVVIAVTALKEIRAPQHAPQWYTLLVLIVVIPLKEAMFRVIHGIGTKIGSTALRSDAWHHRTDALTSLAAFVGISIALIGGRRYQSADDWAALAVSLIIALNGGRLLIGALNDVMDAAAPPGVQELVRKIASETDEVVYVEKCRMRKSGLGIFMDIHVVVDGDITVRQGHKIAHHVQSRLYEAVAEIRDVVVHIEPDDYEGGGSALGRSG